MRSSNPRASLRVEGSLAFFAICVLALCVCFVAAYVFQAPYPGLDYDSQWTVISIEEMCSARPERCSDGQSSIQIGDRLLAVGPLDFDQYREDRLSVPFAGFAPGQHVPITLLRDGRTIYTEWIYVGPTLRFRLQRLMGLLLFLPFWIAGTAVLLMLRPRNLRWLLLVFFNYLTGIWIAVGNFSSWHVAGSAFVLRWVTFLLVPLYLHVHLLMPTVIRLPHRRLILSLLYGLLSILAVLDLLHPLPGVLFNLMLLLAISQSLGLLIYRSINPAAPRADRLTARLMLVGIALCFGPGMLLWILPALFNARTPGWVLTAMTTAALPLQPFFYVYTLYKRRLGNLEFRANRVLSFYSFILLFGTAFVVLFLVGGRWIELSLPGIFFALTVSILFIALALWLQRPFQRFVDRLAYGTVHNPETIVRTFANEIPRALDRDALSRLLVGEVSPALLIRQSALYLVSSSEVAAVYADGVSIPAPANLSLQLQNLLARGRHYIPPEGENLSDQPFGWVRLVIPIQVGDKTIAAWLFGKRDPDDYYPQPDIELLSTLGNQVGVALETARLFEDVQHRASELETAYRDLQRLDRLKDEFVQNVSHELRTPLTFLRGYLDLMLEQLLGPLTPEQQEALSTMSDRTEGVIRLVNGIISQQHANVDEMVKEPVNLVALAHSCVEAMEVSMRRRAAGQSTTTFCLQASDDVPQILGDRRRLAQVLDNLLGNAVKFSPDGGVITIDITPCNYPFGDDSQNLQPAVGLTVHDQGIGIPSAELERIWQRFYQVDGSSTRRFGGMGLGLTIVRGIVEAHGGRIWAESEEGQGSTFHVALPVSPA